MLKIGVVFLSLCLVLTSCQDVTQYSGDILPSFLSLISDILPDYLNNTAVMSLAVNTLLASTDLVFDNFIPPPELPVVAQDIWWGEDDAEDDDSIREFRIQFDETRISRLLAKLNDRETFTKPLEGSLFNYGLNTDVLNQIIERWTTNFDFEARQERLNQFPQYKTNIQGLDIHYIHIVPECTNKTVVPIMLLHGAPLTNVEFIYVLPYLMAESNTYDFVFEIIVPSLPGFGYSQGTKKMGLNTYQAAIILKNLMQRIGFEQYYVHAGDMGMFVASDMATLFPNNVLGLHSNFAFSMMPKTLTKYLIASIYPPAVSEEKYIPRFFPISRWLYNVVLRLGYFHEEATKPDTRGTAFSDSPSGILGWIVEGFSSANQTYDAENGKISLIDVDDALDAATIVWDAKSVTTWFRLYAEYSAWVQDPYQWDIIRNPASPPVAAFNAAVDMIYQPDDWIMDKFPNLVYTRTVDIGGHYFAYQYPDIFATSIFDGTAAMMKFNAKK